MLLELIKGVWLAIAHRKPNNAKFIKLLCLTEGMVQEVLLYVSLVIGTAALLTVIARAIRQPPLIAYLIAGILLSPVALGPTLTATIGDDTTTSELIQIFAHIGVAFLLFIVGLSLDFRVLKEIGGVASIAGLAEIVLTGVIGAVIALALGFGSIEMLYIGAALAFSSTVLVVKILSDKKEIDTLHGRIALGILIVEDFVAALALMAIPLIEHQGSAFWLAGKLAIALGISIGVLMLSGVILPRVMDYLARSQEALFLFGIAWALSLATLFDALGFSLEIGALIAGMSLASSKYTLELGGKIKPLRDFFVVLFFVFFGSQLTAPLDAGLIRKALLFSVFIVIGKPLIVMTILRFFGYRKRTNFLAGSSLAQISEFSLILVLLGFTLGHISQEIMNLVILIAVITIGVSSYSIYYAHSLFARLERLLWMFEGKSYRFEKDKERTYDVILLGYHRMGYHIAQTLRKMRVSFLVVDYNPRVILALAKERVGCVYGDGGDRDFLSEIPLEKAKLVISTIPDEASNLAIRERLHKLNSKAVFIATAEQPRTALNLYEAGADYVLIPHHLGGQYAAHLLQRHHTDKAHYQKLGKQHFQQLRKGKDNSAYSQL